MAHCDWAGCDSECEADLGFVVAAQRRLVAQLRRDPEVVPKTVLAPFLVPRAVARQASLVDDAARVGQIRAAGHSDAGEAPAVALVHRIRDRYIPAARFPATTDVLLTGASTFDELPDVMARLSDGRLRALCHMLTYDEG